ncbi:hypothetical protein [Salipiger bermudensis]|uniref:hypothetical protein n=1 Tax=Salipiger bermudensis TaxID=344736 RepID=UPI001CD48EFF|nr:hypothetical protein [Salipiger bermudensis]MCA0963808.1 hypothetical protein [Salipiger bermudensis]
MRGLVIILFLLSAACNTGGPGFRGLPAQRIEVEGSRFLLRVNGAIAEATRISPEFPARFDPIAERAQKAAFLQTGCEPDWVTGDPAVLVMGLSCDGAPSPKKPRRGRISCAIFNGYASAGLGGSAELECRGY